MRRLLNEKIAPKFVLAAMALAMAAPSWAQTAPALRLTDGINTVTIDSTATVTFSLGCACTTTAVSASSGHVAWSGTIGAFTVSNVNGRTKPSLGSQTAPTIDVGLGGLSTGLLGGVLTITWSDTGFDGLGPVTLNETTTIFGSGMALYGGYVDPSNTLFGLASLVGTLGPLMGNGVLPGPGPTAEQFSMTEVETFTLGSFAFLLNDNQLIGTPVPKLTLACSGASGLAGTLYNSSLVASGGVPSYAFSLLSGSLPPGMSLNSASGLISGTPTATGSFNFVSQVMDSVGATASTASTGGCTIVVTEQTPLSLSCSASTGQVGVPYSSSLVATGGLPPYNMFSIAPVNGLPAGLFLNAMTGAITGTATASGTSNFTAQVVDSNGNTAMNSANNSCSVAVAPAQITLGCSTVTSGEVGAAFNSPAPTVSGGNAPYTFSLTPGSTLPAGLTLNASTGAITGTPTAAGTFSIQVTDSNGVISTSSCPYTIAPPPTLTCSTVNSGEVGVAFNGTAPTVAGGTAPFTFSLAPGSTLPAGLTLNASTGAITGTPTAAGTFNIQVTDSKGVVGASTCPYTIASPPTLTCSTVNSGEVSVAFNGTAPTVAGGTAPFTFSLAPDSTLPVGLTLNASTGAITGTPTAAGTFNIQVTDANGVVAASSCPYIIAPPPTLACSTVNAGEVSVAFNGTAPTVAGGTAPFTFSLAPGSTLPAGLTLNASTGAITGTPTAAGTFNIQVTDANGVVAASTCPYTIAQPPSLICSTVNAGEVNVAFNGTAPTVAGGTAPFTFSLAPGSTLPAGLTLNASTGAITGTPTAAGTFNIQVTDSKGVVAASTCPYTIVPAPTLTCSAVNSGEVSVAFNGTAPTVAGGTGPFTFSLAPGSTLPAGLTLSTSTGAVTGTPTAAGTFNIQVTDANGVVAASTCPYTIVPAPTVTCSAANSGEVGAAFSGAAPSIAGGTAPFTFSLAPGNSLPSGLTLNASTGAITGTPTAAGTFNIQVTDAKGVIAASTCPYTVVPAPSITCSAVNSGEVGAAFNSPAMMVSGGTSPYTFSVATGTLPAGLTLNTANGAITGTATAPGTFTIKVTDANGVSSTGCAFTIMSGPSITCSAVNSGEVGAAFNSPAMTVSGGTSPYTFSVASGTLPAGLTLNTANGAITGTATAPGTFTIKVTDANGVSSTGCAFTIVSGPSITCSAVNSGEVGAAFNSPAMTVSGGTAPYTFSVASGTLPAGLTLNTANGAITGTATAPGTFTIKVTDANGVSSTGCAFTIMSGPSITCSAVNSGEVGAAFNSPAMTVSGGTAPYTFSVASGSLPAGLTLNTANGAITGTATAPGTFTIKVTDANGVSSTGCAFSIMSGPSITCSAVNSGEVGAAFNSPAMTVSGGTAPYTFSVASGTLPAGLTLNTANGAITGTATAPGTFTIKVTDANGVSSTGCAFTIMSGPSITCSAVNSGEVGAAFNSPAMTVSGGTAPYTFSVASGTLPAGLTLNTANGAITGTATAPGTFTIKVTDANGVSSTGCAFTIMSGPSITCSAVNSGEVGAVFNSPAMTVSGGTAPYTFSVASGTLPAGLTLNTANGAITGMATAPGTFTIKVTDANGVSSTGCAFTIMSGPSITCSAVNSGEVGAAFNSPAMTVSGGTAPYTFSVASGSLPTGLTLNTANGAITGMATAPGTFTIKVTDANGVSSTGCAFTIMSGPSITCSAVNSGEVGAAFNSPAMMVSGGTAPYTFSVASGTLPAGLTLNTANGAITGTATAPGTFTIKVTDANGVSSTGCAFTIMSGPSITCSAVNSGEVGAVFNSPAMTVSGGTAPYTFSVASGTLPAGLTLNTANGAITGTATASGTFTIKVTDANGVSSTGCAFTIMSGPSITCSAVNSGEVGAVFNSPAMTVSGGTSPYTFSVATGTLPAGLTLNTTNGAITGTPTGSGTFTIKVTDAKGATSSSCTFTIANAPSLTCSATHSGDVGAAFSSTIVASGGTAPYTYAIATGSLPAGLSLDSSTGVISGTPTATGTFTVKVTDAKGATATSTCPYTIVSALTLACSTKCSTTNSGEVGVPFSDTLSASGGSAPYTYAVATGALPAGLSLNSSTGVISGTPTAAGTFTVKVTDANGVTASSTCTYTIVSPPVMTCSAISSGQTGVAFNGTAPTVSGGTAPYTFSVATGSLPAGLTLNASTGAITGTPTAAGTFTIKVTDSKGVMSTSTCPYTIVSSPVMACSAVNSGQVGVVFNGTAPTVSGGTAPYTFSVATGTLPAGLTLNTSTGAITGKPTAAGTFTIQVKDSKGAVATSTCPYTIVSAPTLACSTTHSGDVGAAFSSTIIASGGTAPYTYAVATGALPAGLSLNSSTGVISGTPTATGTFTIKVTDAKGATAASTCPYTIVSALTLACSSTCSTTNSGQVGVPFSDTLSASGGAPPYAYAVATGALPAGLSLNSSTGVISGTPTAAGTFTIKVTDDNGVTAASTCTYTIVSGGSPVTGGDTATIGFWHNQNGQALILALNGGSNSTSLANWLATQFPYLYGAHSSNNLTNKTNTTVAALFLTFFGEGGQKTDAQIMAGALACYVTSSTLAGSTAKQYGFNSSAGGTGAKTYNVGSDGSGIGLTSNQSFTVLQLLQQANQTTENGTFNANAFNDVFNGINTTGDIS